MNYMFLPLRRYADFEGRSRRKEFWLFMLFYMVVLAILYTVLIGSLFAAAAADYAGTDDGSVMMEANPGLVMGFGIGSVLLLLLVLAMIIPTLAVQIRRLHDQDKSGWWILINLIPLGGIVLLVFYCLEGTRGPNRFGSDPKGDDYGRTFA